MVSRTRITPACAGKRLITSFPTAFTKDHPRMRGEKGKSTRKKRNVIGSPPHARGKEIYTLKKQVKCRITPACAGKRSGN